MTIFKLIERYAFSEAKEKNWQNVAMVLNTKTIKRYNTQKVSFAELAELAKNVDSFNNFSQALSSVGEVYLSPAETESLVELTAEDCREAVEVQDLLTYVSVLESELLKRIEEVKLQITAKEVKTKEEINTTLGL